jgi:hypothetical protein
MKYAKYASEGYYEHCLWINSTSISDYVSQSPNILYIKQNGELIFLDVLQMYFSLIIIGTLQVHNVFLRETDKIIDTMDMVGVLDLSFIN